MTTGSISASVSVAIAQREHATKTASSQQYWRAACADAGLAPVDGIDPLAVGDAMATLGKTALDLRRDVDQLRMATDPHGHVAAAIAQADAAHAEAQAKADEHLAEVARLQAAYEQAKAQTFVLQARVLAASNARDQAHQRRSVGEQRAQALQDRADFKAAGGWGYVHQLRTQHAAATAAGGAS